MTNNPSQWLDLTSSFTLISHLHFPMDENVMQVLHNNFDHITQALKHVVVAETTNRHENMNLAKQMIVVSYPAGFSLR